MFMGIKDNKIFDICSELVNKRTIEDDTPINPEEVQYFEIDNSEFKTKGWNVGDTFDWDTKTNTPDSPERFIVPPKTADQLKIEELEIMVADLETRLKVIEDK